MKDSVRKEGLDRDTSATERTAKSEFDERPRDFQPEDQRRASAIPERGTDESSSNPADTVRNVVSIPDDEPVAPLFSSVDAEELRSRWESVQVGFVDEPKRSVEQADHLVAEAIKHLSDSFGNEKQKLEQQWDRGDGVSTEDLRLSLRRYRSFFQRLLSV